MAANIMELLRQIQRDLTDQKEYMRNLHVINRNINEKIDKQQKTIENIQHHVKKNNMALFGNDDTQLKLHDTAAETYQRDFEENKENDTHLVEKTEKYMENIEAKQIHRENKETESNCVDDNKNNDSFEKADNDNKSFEEFINKESIKDFIASTKISIEGFTKGETDPPTNNITDQIKNLNDKLNYISDIYQSDSKQMKESIEGFALTINTFTEEVKSQIDQLRDELKNISNKTDMKETKESINDLIATLKRSTEETTSMVKLVNKQKTDSLTNNLSVEQISKLCAELKQLNDTYQSEIQAKKELMDDIVASVNKINEVAASRVRKQVLVQITPTYLNTEQIKKLNEELKRITEMYVSTDVFPLIEVQSGPCDHPVMKQLSKGVYFKTKDNTRYNISQLSPLSSIFNKSKVLELLAEYPDLSLLQVIAARRISENKWVAWFEKHHLNIIYHIHKTSDGYEPLNM